jgi:hypothetical protein
MGKEVAMPEYRVMHLNEAYQIQQKTRKGWEEIGEFDNLNSAKMMLRELKGGNDGENKQD